MHKRYFLALILSHAVRHNFLVPPAVDWTRKKVSRFATPIVHFFDAIRVYDTLKDPDLENFKRLNKKSHNPTPRELEKLAHLSTVDLRNFRVYKLPRYKTQIEFDAESYIKKGYFLVPEDKKIVTNAQTGEYDKLTNWFNRIVAGVRFPYNLEPSPYTVDQREARRQEFIKWDRLGLFSLCDISQLYYSPGGIVAHERIDAIRLSKIIQPGVKTCVADLDTAGSKNSRVAKFLQKNKFLKTDNWEKAFLNIEANKAFVEEINKVKLTNGQYTKFNVLQDLRDVIKLAEIKYELGAPKLETLKGQEDSACAVMYSMFQWWGNSYETSGLLSALRYKSHRDKSLALASVLAHRLFPTKYAVYDPQRLVINAKRSTAINQTANLLGFFVSMCCDRYGYDYLKPVFDPREVLEATLTHKRWSKKRKRWEESGIWADCYEGVNSAHYLVEEDFVVNARSVKFDI